MPDLVSIGGFSGQSWPSIVSKFRSMLPIGPNGDRVFQLRISNKPVLMYDQGEGPRPLGSGHMILVRVVNNCNKCLVADNNIQNGLSLSDYVFLRDLAYVLPSGMVMEECILSRPAMACGRPSRAASIGDCADYGRNMTPVFMALTVSPSTTIEHKTKRKKCY